MDGDLISRKALIERYGEPCHSFLDVIETMPAIDAEQVRHAQWNAANCRGTLCDTYVCSECGNMVTQAEGYTYSCTYNYCPHCGAKMDVGEDNRDVGN